MKLLQLISLSFFLLFQACVKENGDYNLVSGSFKLSIDNRGSLTELIDLKTNQNHLAKDSLSSLMSIRIKNEIFHPQSAELTESEFLLIYRDSIEARIEMIENESYISFELLSLTHADKVDLIIWGPYRTTISKIIGETVGVVRNDEFAIGLQALNIKTLGGYPWNESDRMPQFDIFEKTDPNEMHPDNDGSVLYRVEAAKPTNAGSSLQAYCRNRNKERIIKDFNHEMIVAPPYKDGGLTGSKIALFGVPDEEALETIGEIELTENLPHPMIDGKWVKMAPGASASYLITDFHESTIQKAIDLTKKAGLKYLYHYGETFKSWGHFELNIDEFPNGYEGLEKCVELAEAQGVMVGTHVLSNFITTNDPYVTPIPDKRLARVGSSIITEDISDIQTKIPIQSPEFFNQMANNNLKTVVIGEELIRYGDVSKSEPWTLMNCQRGVFGTHAISHNAGDAIGKLLDHAYKVFLTDADLTIEMSKNIAEVYNQTGLRQISFDGLEGNRSTGLGTYGESLMPYTWYNDLSDDLRKHLIIDASRTTHFFWHIYTRMNWGEPWYAGFRESQTEYRLKNQKYFRRNYMPGMLGWFKMTPETSVEDIEWLLARSAAYDAGFAFVAGDEAIEKNGQTDKILELIGRWEKVRLAGVFSEDQKQQMEGTETEFTLEKVSESEWNLIRVYSNKFRHEYKDRQPGEPHFSTFSFTNSGEDQELDFIIMASDTDVSGIRIELDNYKEVTLPVKLKKGQYIKYTGGNQVYVYDKTWHQINTFEVDSSEFTVSNGDHSLTFDCDFQNPGEAPLLKVEVRTFGQSEKLILENEQ